MDKCVALPAPSLASHGGNAAVPRQEISSRHFLSTHIRVRTDFMLPAKSKYCHPWQQWQGAAMISLHMDVLVRALSGTNTEINRNSD